MNETPLLTVSGGLLVLASLLLAWVILTDRIKLSLGVEYGLALIAIAVFASGISAMSGQACDESPFLFRAWLVGVGLLLIIWSVGSKALKMKHPIRRVDDFKSIATRRKA